MEYCTLQQSKSKRQTLRNGENLNSSYHVMVVKQTIFEKTITVHTKNQGSMAPSKEQNKLKETVPEEAQTLDLVDKNFKITILNIPKELKESMDKKLKEIREIMEEQMRISKEKL